MKKIVITLIIALAAIATVQAQESVDLSMSGPGVKEISVTNKGLAYDVKEIKVRAGDTLRITYTNGGGFHDLVFDDFNVATNKIGFGKSETIEFSVLQAGEYEYYCSVGNHRAMGMWGTLYVVE